MKSFEYTPLSSWLGNADTLYLDARVLWLQVSGMGGGLVLMWFAIEQLIKTVVFQERIKKSENRSTNAKEMFLELDRWGRSLRHDLSNNKAELYKYYPSLFTDDEEKALANVYDHFEARYVDNKSRGIEIKALNQLDAVFFKLRDLISEDLPMSHMDMIDINRSAKINILDEYTRFAYLNNPHFHKRSSYRE